MKNYVLTITPNPALDLSGVVDNLRPNEKSYVHDEVRSPGGNAINVARILTRLKVPSKATGFLGGSIGLEIKSLLDKEKVKNHFIEIKASSRICVTVSNREDHQQTRLTFPGPDISRGEWNHLLRFIKSERQISLLVIGGSLPHGLSTKNLRQLMDLARRQGIECIVDCPAAILKDLIFAKPLMIKPNLTEFQELTGSNIKTLAAVLKEAQKLVSQIPFVCVSSVEGGTLLVTPGNAYFGRIPKVKIRSTVGAGDSMVGAMAAQFYHENTSPEDILRWGLAASAATLAQPGTAAGSAEDIRRLYKKTRVQIVR